MRTRSWVRETHETARSESQEGRRRRRRRRLHHDARLQGAGCRCRRAEAQEARRRMARADGTRSSERNRRPEPAWWRREPWRETLRRQPGAAARLPGTPPGERGPEEDARARCSVRGGTPGGQGPGNRYPSGRGRSLERACCGAAKESRLERTALRRGGPSGLELCWETGGVPCPEAEPVREGDPGCLTSMHCDTKNPRRAIAGADTRPARRLRVQTRETGHGPGKCQSGGMLRSD